MSVLSAYSIPFEKAQLPRVTQVALSLLGVQEVVGRGSNRTIMSWRDELNQAYGIDPNAQKIVGYSDDDIPWCGLAAAYVWFKAGKPVVENPLWARNWAKAGEPVAERIAGRWTPYRDRVPSLGDRLVFVRNGGGHVGDYICEDATHYGVAGGNQANKFSIVAIEKSRCIAVRRPPMTTPPLSAKPFVVKKVPARTSVNEA
jgi:uncharacterized protein (TIGR02594 family)